MKHIKNTNLKKSLLGYKPSLVEERLKSQEDYYTSLLAEQKQRIDELKAQLKSTENQLTIFKCKEDDIGKALVSASEKAEDIETDLKLQYALEIERLKIFQAKWTNAYDELQAKYHFDKDSFTMEALVADTAMQLERVLSKDFGLAVSSSATPPEQQFRSELDRLAIPEKELNLLIDELKQAL